MFHYNEIISSSQLTPSSVVEMNIPFHPSLPEAPSLPPSLPSSSSHHLIPTHPSIHLATTSTYCTYLSLLPRSSESFANDWLSS